MNMQAMLNKEGLIHAGEVLQENIGMVAENSAIPS